MMLKMPNLVAGMAISRRKAAFLMVKLKEV